MKNTYLALTSNFVTSVDKMSTVSPFATYVSKKLVLASNLYNYQRKISLHQCLLSAKTTVSKQVCLNALAANSTATWTVHAHQSPNSSKYQTIRVSNALTVCFKTANLVFIYTHNVNFIKI